MSLLEQQHFLVKLYTDEKIRKEFVAEPSIIGKANNLSENEITDILEILPDEIQAFAESLFYKRLREVERFLPLLKRELGENFENFFHEFAQIFTPLTVKKHLEDAIEFAKFFQKHNPKPVWLKDIAKFEQAKLEIGGLGKLLMIKKFDFDIRELHKNSKELNRRKTFAVWLNVGKYHKHFIL